MRLTFLLPALLSLAEWTVTCRQFQKAIKKVRAVQRMRRNRGFAFSQSEQQGEQTHIVRAYDTTQAKLQG